jgi:hypothetical protein
LISNCFFVHLLIRGDVPPSKRMEKKIGEDLEAMGEIQDGYPTIRV